MIEARAIDVVRHGTALLDGVSLAAERGEVVGIVGPNGSGKTTLLRSLYGACPIDAGEIILDGAQLSQLSRRAIARRIAVVPQGQPLDGEQSVADLVRLGRLPHQGWFSAARAQDDDAIVMALERVSLLGLARRPLRLLSGGEVQRALIARALCQEADHLLLDEPTNHLDLGYQHEILAFIRGLGLTTVVVLHDLNLAARYCDRLVLLGGGRVVASGTPDTVLSPERIAQIYRVPTTRITAPSGRPHLMFAEPPSTEDLT